jgi:hypothetical protein
MIVLIILRKSHHINDRIRNIYLMGCAWLGELDGISASFTMVNSRQASKNSYDLLSKQIKVLFGYQKLKIPKIE